MIKYYIIIEIRKLFCIYLTIWKQDTTDLSAVRISMLSPLIRLVEGSGTQGGQVFLLHKTVRLGTGHHGRKRQANGDFVAVHFIAGLIAVIARWAAQGAVRAKGGGQLVPILPVYSSERIILWQVPESLIRHCIIWTHKLLLQEKYLNLRNRTRTTNSVIFVNLIEFKPQIIQFHLVFEAQHR